MDAHLITWLPRHAGLYLVVPNDKRPNSYCPCSLTNVVVRASIVDTVSRVVLSQTFSNTHADSVHEVLYRFPLYEDSAVCDFEAEHSGHKIAGIVKPNEEAEKTYEISKAQGKTAALVLQKEADIFQVKVGNISPNVSVTVTLTYITPLKHDSELNGVRFTLPTCIAFRYGDASMTGLTNVSTSGAGFELSLHANMPGQIQSISSPSHPISVSFPRTSEAQVSLSNTSPGLDRDVVILVAAEGIDEPHCMVEKHSASGTTCAMITLVPRFYLQRVPTEVIFIIDRSGSMDDKLDPLKRALQLFLKSLPASPEIYFNMCSFGSRFDYLFKDGKSQKYDSKTLKIAEKYVSKIDADYGGTEILNPLQDCMKKRRTDCQTTMILLTDAEVYNTDSIINSVSEARAKHVDKPLRVFCLGIGNSVSHHLVEGIARAGGGYSQLVMEQERLDKKVVRMLLAGLQASLDDLHIHWPGSPAPGAMQYKFENVQSADDFEVLENQSKTSTTFFDRGATDQMEQIIEPPPEPPEWILSPPIIQQCPETIPKLYNAFRHVTFILFPDTHAIPHDVTLKGNTPDGTKMSLTIPVKEVKSDDKTPILHTLAARTLLGELEEGRLIAQQKNAGHDSLSDAVRKEAIRVAMKFHLASKWTGFVAVDEALDKSNIGRNMEDWAEHDVLLYEGGEEFDELRRSLPTTISLPAACPAPPPPPACLPSAHHNSFKDGATTSAGYPRRAKEKASSTSFGSAFRSIGSGSVMPGGSMHSKRRSRGASAIVMPRPSSSAFPSNSDLLPYGGYCLQSAVPSDEHMLHRIVMQQSSSGAFPSNSDLLNLIGFRNINDANQKLPPPLKVTPAEVWVTILTCVFLENKLPKEKEAWELVVEKAWAYVAACVSAEKVAQLKVAAQEAMAI